MKFSSAVTFGEIITFLSIAGSGLSIVVSWGVDRDLRVREDADKIRIEAAHTLGKLQRTQDIYLSFYDAVQGDLVEASEKLVTTKNNIQARDLLWKQLQQRKYETSKRLLDEQLEIAYTGLLAFDTDIDSIYNSTTVRLKKLNKNQMEQLLLETEKLVLDFKFLQGQTAVLGNALRAVVANYRADHEVMLKKGINPLETHLKDLINSPDKVLLKR